ncbi:hypothetical protein MRB53_032799 [Persea americana]|uniref:Uncharacterized protein n=1 Tax=Persea americana TaxID=3435 RepID=A0ACC2KU35_PERAE|nr:hypothetical protein MRB53_032799 [Persea americana]
MSAKGGDLSSLAAHSSSPTPSTLKYMCLEMESQRGGNHISALDFFIDFPNKKSIPLPDSCLMQSYHFIKGRVDLDHYHISNPWTKDYTSQFPVNNLFAAASEGNGPPCGREYLVTCLSAAAPNACIDGQTIQVVIVDYIDGLNSSSSQNGTTMVLSNNAFATMIADQLAAEINIEFQQ